MQLSVFVAVAIAFLPAALAHPGRCQRPPTSTCDGDLKCCSNELQGNVASYCSDGNAPPEGCGTGMVTVCCDKDAVKDLTPRGYTYIGCKMPEEA